MMEVQQQNGDRRATNQEILRHVSTLIHLGSSSFKCMQEAFERLEQELALCTDGSVQLLLSEQIATGTKKEKQQLTHIPVQYAHKTYGYLQIDTAVHDPLVPDVSFEIAQMLAEVCGHILFGFALAQYVQGQEKRLDRKLYKKLSKTELQVLTLMGQGHSDEEMMEELDIKPGTLRKHIQKIYNGLGVHHRQDALLKSYFLHLTSPFASFIAS